MARFKQRIRLWFFERVLERKTALWVSVPKLIRAIGIGLGLGLGAGDLRILRARLYTLRELSWEIHHERVRVDHRI